MILLRSPWLILRDEGNPHSMAGVIEWLGRRRSIAAAVAALYVVFRVARWVGGIGWSFGRVGFLESAADFLSDHWLAAAAVLAAIFLATFVAVRATIGELTRRVRRNGSDAPAAQARLEP